MIIDTIKAGPGDSYEINTFGHLTQGFVISHYMVQTTYNNNSANTEVYFWLLIDKHNTIVCFRDADIINTSRIVLTEKLKYPVKWNEDFNDKMVEAQKILLQNERLYRARRIGMSAQYAQEAFLNLIKDYTNSDKKLIIISGNSK